MIHVNISEELRGIAPQYCGAFIEARVQNSPTSEALWEEIARLTQELRTHYDPTTVKERDGIRETRAAYRAAGKDPSRYRPACEQLCRRVLQGKDLYSIETLVDLGNAVSMRSGYTVAVVDRDKISGESITLGIGREGEAYEAIGRGPLNIHRMPVFRDETGGFATPTSDHVRTQCSADTTRVLIIINGYDGNAGRVDEAVQYALSLLRSYACAQDEEILQKRHRKVAVIQNIPYLCPRNLLYQPIKTRQV